MRVLFANPLPWEPITKEGRVIIPLNVTLEPFRLPLSMCLAAGQVRAAVPGTEVAVTDCQAERLDARGFERLVADWRPELVVINVSSPTLGSDLHAAATARRSGAKVAMFGHHAQALPRDLLESEPDVDFAVTGEPEPALAGLVRDLTGGGIGVDVPGIAARDAQGRVRLAGPPERLDINALARPARDLVDNDLYRLPDGERYTLVLAGRGCPFDCAFCLAPGMHGHNVRLRDPADLVDEVVEARETHRITSFLFQADLFTAKRRWVEQVCDELLARAPGVRWICNTRIDTVDRPLLERMRAAGLFLITFGLESGDPRMLKILGKPRTSPDDIRRTVKDCYELGIRTNGSFVIGHPGETRESLARTRDLILSLPLDMAVLMCSTPHPGTPLYEQLRDGPGFLTNDFTDYTFNRYVVGGTDLDPDEVARFIRDIRRRFYLSPRYFVRRLRDLREPIRFLRTIRFGVGRLIESRFGFRVPESLRRPGVRVTGARRNRWGKAKGLAS